MISLKDYAAQKGISYEAVRQQVNRYAAELEGHITKVNRTQFLDDEAVDFLDQKRAGNPVVIIQQNKDEQIEQLQQEVDHLKTKIISLYERLDLKDEEISRLTAANQELLAAAPEAEDESAIDVEPGSECRDDELLDISQKLMNQNREAYTTLAGEPEQKAAPEPEAPASIMQRIKFLITGKM